ncbi:MAG TPA: hydrogenase formation protein HypD [Bacillota bacterium]|nr:hydrogenase formation protein HypD [Bacillota bacterium]
MDSPLPVNSFSDKRLAAQAMRRIRSLRRRLPGDDPVPIMEVCGTHSHVLGKTGLRELLGDAVEYRSGPGCPVCVTDPTDLDMLVRFALQEKVLVAAYGDLLRVPGTEGSLLEQKARGARVSLVYSALDVLELARQNEKQQVVFAATGFETTAPGTALLILEAKAAGLKNLSVLSLHKLMPPALRQLLSAGRGRIEGLILPGHVSAVTGRRAFDFLASELGCRAVVAGFEPLDVLHATALLLEMAAAGRCAVANAYRRVVSEEGNTAAKEAMAEVFAPEAALWRGLGEIEDSGLGIKPGYAAFDAKRRFGLEPGRAPGGGRETCRCGEVLRGAIRPPECPLFGTKCTPAHPQGVCMVSTEGACASYF